MMTQDPILQRMQEQVQRAHASGLRLFVRGSGSKSFLSPFHVEGAATAQDGFEEILTCDHSGVLAYEPSELVITARAGTKLTDLEATLAAQGQCLPFEPPHFGPHATVGGMVAAGLSGPARAVVGSVRDYVLGLHLINGRGEILQFGGQVMKNVAGYDVSRLMVGSWGILGLITQVSIKVLPKAIAQTSLRLQLSEAVATEQINRWMGQSLPINASCWLVEGGVETLYVRLSGAQAAVSSATQRLQMQGAQLCEGDHVQRDWCGTREQTLPWFEAGMASGKALWRMSLPPTTLPLNLGDTLVEWLGGQRWLWLDPQDTAGAARLMQTAKTAGGSAKLFRVAKNASTMGETAQAVHAQRFQPLPAVLAQIHQRLKQEFDPSGVFPALPPGWTAGV